MMLFILGFMGSTWGRCALSAQNVNFLARSVTPKHRSFKVFTKPLPGWSDHLVVGRRFLNCFQYTTGTEQRSRCSDQATGLMVRGSNPIGGKKFTSFADLLWSLPTFLVNGYRRLVHGLKRPGGEFEHSLPSNSEVNHEKKHNACIVWAWIMSSFLCTRERELYSTSKEAVVATPNLKPHPKICLWCLKKNTKCRN